MPKKPTSAEPIGIEFDYQPKQKAALRLVERNGGQYVELAARHVLEVGGQRSGKTLSKLMHGVQDYCLKFKKCNILVLRRTFPELDAGAIQDFKTFVPRDLYDWNATTRVATLINGSQVTFAGCIREGSLVDTSRGLVPIELVTTKDFVLTRKGYRRVLWSGMTGIKPTVRVGNTWLTVEHPVYCNGEFIPAEQVCQKALEKTVCLQIQRSSYLKAAFIVDTQIRKDLGTETISQADGQTVNTARFMSQFGKAFTGLFRKAWRFITRMDFRSTIERTTSNLLSVGNTVVTTNRQFTSQSSNGALYAEESLLPYIPPDEQLALRNVEEFPYAANRVDSSPPSPVYDLTVEGEHEFFADGLLVHNCANNVERDIEKYLGQAYPYILVDECAQFSPEVWQRLSMRNLINAGCEPDEHGNFPTPAIVGCTNPIGSFWEYYHTLFVKKKPWDMEDGMRQARDGSWWAPRAGEYECVYDPRHYYYNHSTVLDNPLYLKRDPTIVERLRAMPPDMRDRFLYGVMDKGVGQYFDCWSPEHHVVDLRTDPEAIVWEDWQPVWGGQDYGVGHWNAIYLFTKAKVRSVVNDNYKTKTVCFVEIAPEQTGQTGQELVNMLDAKAYYPRLPINHPQYERISGKRCKLSALYFSHEKFSRVMERHSPADEYSRLLRQKGLPSVSRATMDRIGSASFMYNELKLGNLVVLATCQGIIQAIPALMRDPDHLDDVLKAATKADDRYDAFRYGLFGGLAARGRPQNERDQEYAESITDPMAKYFYLRKRAYAAQAMKQEFKQEDQPVWYDKV